MSLRHPFGFLDGDRVVPAEVEDGETAVCPAKGCDDQLHVRGPSTSGTVRHFWHPSGGGEGGNHGSGSGGESATHKNYKSHAASALLNFFGDFVRESTTKEVFEQRIDVPGSDQYRLADALVTFQSSNDQYGKGVAIEVQHENKGKDIDTVTEEYLSAGYSVFWTDSETHYEPGRHLFDREQLDDEIVSVWPNAVPDEWSGYEYYFPIIHARAGRPPWEYKHAHSPAAAVFDDIEFSRPSRPRRTTLPQEWYEGQARELFRETLWHELFSGYEWETRSTLPSPDNGAKRNEHVDALLLHEWAGPPEKEAFRDTPWDDLFIGYEHPVEQIASQVTATAQFPERWTLPLFREKIVDELAHDDIPHPGHSFETAKKCLRNCCSPGEHEWIELNGSPSAYWRECRRCGINDETWYALYGRPNQERQSPAEAEAVTDGGRR